MAKRKKIRGNIVTNLDIELDDKKRSEMDRDEWNDHVISGVEKEDTKQYLGEAKVGEVEATFDQLEHEDAALYKDNHRITPISHMTDPKDGSLVWVLNQADSEAVREGRFCPQCLEPQESRLTVECQFRGKDYGCGFKQKLV